MDDISIYVIKYCEELKKYIKLKPHRYDLLIEELWSTPFRYMTDVDERRVRDARYYIRGRFDEDGVLDENDVPISVFEMILALSYRCEHDVMGSKGDSNFDYWFWIFMENLGLDRYDDRHFNVDEVDRIIDDWLDGEFDDFGVGSPFRFKEPIREGWKFGIWNLMNRFLSDFYL